MVAVKIGGGDEVGPAADWVRYWRFKRPVALTERDRSSVGEVVCSSKVQDAIPIVVSHGKRNRQSTNDVIESCLESAVTVAEIKINVPRVSSASP